ncbi:MAG: GDP-mannose 4,6-dehydratase [Candidatus Methylomirabilales bacterium]
MAERALITGITGQDGSYLAELLLEKGYKVFGLVRRLSTPNIGNIDRIADDVTLLDGDLMDQSSLSAAVKESEPSEVYNLAAQSFVGTSFVQPVLTGEITGLGVLRLLEAVRANAPDARVYQASSSEMFGRVEVEPQVETTPFHPRSPYGVAKVYGYWACVNYREAHDLYVSNGILFNHECVTPETPIIVRQNGFVDCLPISEVVRDPRHKRRRQLDLEIWDRDGFTKALFGSAKWNGHKNDRAIHRVVARCGQVRTTADHVLPLQDGNERAARELRKGDRVLRTHLPAPPSRTHVLANWAYLLGLLAADGYIGYREGRFSASFRNNDSDLLDRVQALWESHTAGSVKENNGISGYTGEPTGGIHLNCDQGTLRSLREALYTRDAYKRVPRIILNSGAESWTAFLRGYNKGDGLKGGHGAREFKNFKSSSPTLAAGLYWMASQVLGQRLTFNVDFVQRPSGEYAYHSINLNAPGDDGKGRHLRLPSAEVKRVKQEPYLGWLYDIETATGTFHAGVGDVVIHNSPRRGLEFVTRKISHRVAGIHLGKADRLSLGELDVKRDWGYAPEYAELMWRILQHEEPDDFVGATGKSHSVRDFVTEAFRVVGIDDWESRVSVEERHFRPAEVYNLRGDASKAKKLLGWEPKVQFRDLVKIMVEADVARLKAGKAA